MEKYLQELVAKIPEIKGVQATIKNADHPELLKIVFTWTDAEGTLKEVTNKIPRMVELRGVDLQPDLNCEEARYLVGQYLREGRLILANLRQVFLGETWAVWRYDSLNNLQTALNEAHTHNYKVHQVVPYPEQDTGIIVLYCR